MQAYRLRGIRGRFLRTMATVYILVAALAVLVMIWVMNRTADSLGNRLAGQHAARERDRVLSLVQSEIALCRKLADSPVIRDWLLDESAPDKRGRALAELASFRHHCRDQSYFVAARLTNNFYLSQRQDPPKADPQMMQLSEINEDDRWFYATLANVPDFDLNVDYNGTINEIRVWINTVVHDDHGEAIGVLGTSVSLDQFIDEVVAQSDRAVTPIIFASDTGAIKVHPNRQMIDQNTVDKPNGTTRAIWHLLPEDSDRLALSQQVAILMQHPKLTRAIKLTFSDGKRLCGLAVLPDLDWVVLAREASNWPTSSTMPRKSMVVCSSSSLPASILEISRISLSTVNNAWAELRTVSAKLRWRWLSSVRSSSSVMPMTPFMGVRISWLILARKSLFAALAALAASSARWRTATSLSSCAVRSLTRISSSSWWRCKSCVRLAMVSSN